MKVLFVCWANVGRSQVAKAFYNQLTGTQDADSAGTEVEMPGETLGERQLRKGGTHIIQAMDEKGIDIRGYAKTQLSEDMLDRYDKIICMAQPEYTPPWLEQHDSFVRWDVADPGGKAIEESRIARDAIETKVTDLTEHVA
jgi:protein-tyrosine-phosphatase